MKSWLKALIIAVFAVVIGLIAGAALMWAIGSNPLEGFSYLLQGTFMSPRRFGDMLATATPLIFTGLSVAFAFRTGLFNIGAAGQFLIGGFCALVVGFLMPAGPLLTLPLMLLAAILGGGIWGVIPGLLKARFNVHEVVSTIMMNFIAFWSVNYAVPAWFKGAFETESKHLAPDITLRAPWLSQFFQDEDGAAYLATLTDPGEIQSFLLDSTYMNQGIILGIVAVILTAVFLGKTVKGFELKAVGFNRHAAEYAGMNVNGSMVLSMAVAGALAGLGGLTYYAGYSNSMQIGILPPQGFDGIAVALLGAISPIGVFFSAIFFGILQSGKGFMNAMTDIPPEIGDVIIAVIIYFAATSVMMERILDHMISRKKKGGR